MMLGVVGGGTEAHVALLWTPGIRATASGHALLVLPALDAFESASQKCAQPLSGPLHGALRHPSASKKHHFFSVRWTHNPPPPVLEIDNPDF